MIVLDQHYKKGLKMTIISNNMENKFFGVSGVTIINGKEYKGTNITINNNEVIIDGNVISDIGALKSFTINGNVESIQTTSGDIIVHGEVKDIRTTSGDIEVDGNVSGDIQTTSGDVKCKNVAGSIKTVSGDVR